MIKRDEFEFPDQHDAGKQGLVILVGILVILLIVTGVYFGLTGRKEAESAGAQEIFSVEGTGITEAEIDTQETSGAEDTEESTTEYPEEVPVRQVLVAGDAPMTDEITLGIDVSRYQGTIDWAKVAAAGIDFAMIRVGNRTLEDGTIVEDSNARYNLQEATANGVRVGAYFFSTAISEAEALEEADWTAELLKGYPVTYPVVYDCERYEKPESRQHYMTKGERSALAEVFLERIYEHGYTPMIYGGRSELDQDAQWLTSELEQRYMVWVAWYPEVPFPETPDAGYAGAHDMWQYSNTGSVDGIEGPVDRNVAYFGYDGSNAAKDKSGTQHAEADKEAGHVFAAVDETVTAKDATNLRDIPAQGEGSTVMLTLQNGQTAQRTGVSDSGWSRVVFNGETYYAVSSLLTTDLTVKAPEPAQEGIKTQFVACDENVSAKIEVNLRNIPSVTNTESVVVATVKYGEIFHRTGINTDYGWSRVEYNGQTLYCVSSYIYVVEEAGE